MPIRGQIKEVLIPPRVVKDLDPKESLLPATIELRNIRVTIAGNSRKRNGYAQKWDVSNDVPVNLLIPEGVGYATDNNGNLYRLDSTILTLDRGVAPGSRPTWQKWIDTIYIWSGGIPIKITPTGTAVVGGNPVHAKWSAIIGTYMIVAGHHDTEFRWSAPGDPDDWTVASGGGFTNIEQVGKLKNMIEYKKHLLFFTDRDIEVRALSSGSTPFVIVNNLHVNKGLLAEHSVVKASNDRLYWLADDNDFYMMDNFSVQNISTSYSRELFTMNNPDKVKGFDIAKEKHIKWVNQEDGKTYIYDYQNNLWSEDNIWVGSGWEAFPMNSYMELNGKQYFGDINCTGLIHEISDDYLDDNGEEIRSIQRFAVQLSERGNRVRVNRMRLRRKGGTGTLAETSPQILIEYRWDKTPFRPLPNIAQGSMGTNNPYIDIYSLGIGRELELEITEMQDVKYLLTSMLITYEEMND